MIGGQTGKQKRVGVSFAMAEYTIHDDVFRVSLLVLRGKREGSRVLIGLNYPAGEIRRFATERSL